jgi:putative ABC transport system substrate-binding protein
MRRRQVIKLLGGAAAAWPLTARAQQPAMPVIGLMGADTATAQSQWTAAFVHRLHELGWTEGRNVGIEYRWAEGRSEHFGQFAAEFVRLKVAVILTHNTPLVVAAKRATSVIPIVFATAADPVGTGLVASLARPGGNVTGLSSQSPDLAGKQIELLREVVPGLRRLAMLGDPDNPYVALQVREVQAAARAFGLEAALFEIRRAEDITTAFDRLKGRAEALYVLADPVLFANRLRINTLALGARLPTMHGVREYVEASGLLSYDKILRGTKPGDIPVEQPTKFEFIINLTTAKALGLTIPASLMSRADELIE